VKAAVLGAIAIVVGACHAGDPTGTDDDEPPPPPDDSIYAEVDAGMIRHNLEALTDAGQRWSPDAKAAFRATWRAYYEGLGMTVSEQTFPIDNLVGETRGHNMEAILPGTSPDSVVIIVHYDTVGIDGHEADNPGTDDDGSGLVMMAEAARIFAAHPERDFTVRFVAADYEEISDDLDGDYAYVDHLQAEAAAEGFTIKVASDDDQTGWSCWSEDLCGHNPPARNTTFQMISCSGDDDDYDYPELSAGIIALAERNNSPMTPRAICDGSGDTDHYPFWVAGLPAYVIEEYGSEHNPHYDDTGDDTMAHIDLDMLSEISRIQIAFQAELAGVH